MFFVFGRIQRDSLLRISLELGQTGKEKKTDKEMAVLFCRMTACFFVMTMRRIAIPIIRENPPKAVYSQEVTLPDGHLFRYMSWKISLKN